MEVGDPSIGAVGWDDDREVPGDDVHLHVQLLDFLSGEGDVAWAEAFEVVEVQCTLRSKVWRDRFFTATLYTSTCPRRAACRASTARNVARWHVNEVDRKIGEA